MIRLHHLEKSRSHRILWLLETLALDYELVEYQRDPKTQLAPEALRRIHPLGKSPVITDGEQTVAESGAIIDYLLGYYGDGRCQPDAGDTRSWVDYRYWLHYAEGSLMPLLVMQLVFGQLPKQSPWLIRPIARGIHKAVNQRFLAPQLERHMAMIEAYLAEHGGFASAWPSGADIQMSFPLQALAMTRRSDDYPAIAAFVERIEADAAWQRAVERAGPLRLPG
ncbi:MAG: glutathione S-transferase [Halomonas sp.]|nr:glutathione S-transferase [Halomonas sp.]MDN6297938.1 glutathione S-transferase [Halomonas sp.]MDN6315187.1 glutathione S-transferase [Halomonas sp.]MDN6336518.1 glutathione S-transferase [Halomonas sp.]